MASKRKMLVISEKAKKSTVQSRDDYRFFKTVKNGSNFKEFNRNEFQDFRFLTVFRLVKDFFFLTIFSSKPCVAVLTFSVLLLPWQLHGNRSGSTTLWTKLKFKLILIILFPMAPTRGLSDKYLLSYYFLKIKIIHDFISFLLGFFYDWGQF